MSVPVLVHQPAPDSTWDDWLDSAPDLSCTDSTQAYWVDGEHQPTDLAVGGRIPRGPPFGVPPVSWRGQGTWGCAWRFRRWPQPQRGLGRLHGLVDHGQHLGGQRVQIDLLT
jgi:hypothetical protein